MSNAADLWAKVVDLLALEVSSATISTFFADARAIALRDQTLAVDVRSTVAKDVIERHYIDMVKEVLSRIMSVPADCLLLAGEAEVAAYEKSLKQDSGAITPTRDFTFDSFVVGNSNRFAHAAAVAVSQNPATAYNPLFIHGGSGLGKTHLLYAIANVISDRQPATRIIYKRGDEFTNELIEAIRDGKNIEFRERYRQADLFLMDDIQFIAGKDSTQEEFFHTFNTLYEAGKQIVLTSDRPPKEMTRLEDRLKTRFESGLLCDIQPPDIETRVAIIRNKAKRLGLQMSDEAVMYMAENITANVRQIEGAVKKVHAFQLLLHEDVDISVVSTAIKDLFQENPGLNPTPSMIIEETEKHYGLSPGEILGSHRGKHIALARHVAVYLTRSLTRLSLPDIGAAFGRHHSTIMHSVEQVEQQKKTDKQLADAIQDILYDIKNRDTQ